MIGNWRDPRARMSADVFWPTARMIAIDRHNATLEAWLPPQAQRGVFGWGCAPLSASYPGPLPPKSNSKLTLHACFFLLHLPELGGQNVDTIHHPVGWMLIYRREPCARSVSIRSARLTFRTKSIYSVTRLSAQMQPPRVMAAICRNTLNCGVTPR